MQIFRPWIGTDIFTQPGDSGGALVTAGSSGEYELVGIMVGATTGTPTSSDFTPQQLAELKQAGLWWPPGTSVAVTLGDALDAVEREEVPTAGEPLTSPRRGRPR